MPARIRIRVGASLDASAKKIFEPLVQAAERAKVKIASDSEVAGEAIAKSTRKGATKAEESFKKIAKESKIIGDAIGKSCEEGATSGEKAFKHLMDQVEHMADEMAKGPVQSWGQAMSHAFGSLPKTAPTLKDLGQHLGTRLWTRARKLGQTDVTEFLNVGKSGLHSAYNAGESILRASGTDLSLESQVGKNVAFEKTVTDITNSGFMPGTSGAAGQRQDPAKLMDELRDSATATGYEVTKAAEGLQAFVGKTGDLQGGRDVFRDLATLSRATGTELEDMVSAAGDVSNNLGDIPNKGERLVEIMRAVAGQGKLGAVEIKDLAVQMAKIASVAPQFAAGPTDTMAALGALAQEARQRGGAASASQAATSVQRFVGTFQKGARMEAFKSFGVQVQDEKGQYLDPEKIITSALKGAEKKGGLKNLSLNMGKMFADVTARRATRGFETIFAQAGGGKAGEEALHEEFKRLREAAMGVGETMDSFHRSMNTTDAKTAVLNNRLSALTNEFQTSVTPALIAFADAAISGMQAFNKAFGIATSPAEEVSTAVGQNLQGTNTLSKAKHALETGKISKEDYAALIAETGAQKEYSKAQTKDVEEMGHTGFLSKVGHLGADIVTLGATKEARETVEHGKVTAAQESERQTKELVEVMRKLTDAMKAGTVLKTDPKAPPTADNRGRTPSSTGSPPRHAP